MMMMKTLTKALAGTIAAGAMAVASISPAHASGGKISAGEIIAGALVIGGIAAIAASGSSKRDHYGYGYDRRGYQGNHPRHAVDMCVRAAESRANRVSYGRSRVTDIRKVSDKRNGFDVEGRITVNSRYARGGYETGRFTCKVRYGRVDSLRFRNIRGL